MSDKSKVNPIAAFLSKRSQDAMQLQQIITYLIATCLVMVGMPLHLFNILGSKMPTLQLLSVVAMFVCAVTFVLWLFHRVSVTHAFTFTSFIVLAVQMAKILYISLTMPPGYSYLAVINSIISMMLMTMLAISYLRLAAIIVGIVNVVTMVYAAMVMHQRIVWQFVIIIILFSVFFIFMTDMMYRNVKRMQTENTQYRNGEQRLLHTLRLNRNEIRAYIEMCRKENPDDNDTDRLFSMLSEASQRNVINAVERKKAIDASRTNDIQELLPDLTPMELEVSRLILRDMKLSQIADYTGKSESNISVVRSRIRKKLNLSPGDDLREELLKKLGKSI